MTHADATDTWGDASMFYVDCPTHGTTVLLPRSRIVHIENHDSCIVLRRRCWCDHEGETTTGRRAA